MTVQMLPDLTKAEVREEGCSPATAQVAGVNNEFAVANTHQTT